MAKKQRLQERREEVVKMSDEEITKEFGTLRKELFNLRCSMVNEGIEDTTMLRETRKQIARLLTEQARRNPQSKQAKADAKAKAVATAS